MTQERCPVWLCLGSFPHTSSGPPVVSQLVSHPEDKNTHFNGDTPQPHYFNDQFICSILCSTYLSERQLHVGVSIEVIASDSLSDLSDMCWRRRTYWLLLLCGRHLLLECEEKEEVRQIHSAEVGKQRTCV